MRKKTPREPRESALASGWTVEGEGAGIAEEPPVADPVAAIDAATADPPEPGEEGAPRQMSNGALVVLGVFGGLYMLYAWGWLVIAQAYAEFTAFTAAGSGALGQTLQQILLWAAPGAPVLWFLAALAASRGGRTRRLALLLLVGAVVLLPLPMLVASGA
ncbi:hypothetical protein MUN78_05005 [Leucobacter allii]|uniref:DNA polymerase III subunit gamma/tau n=1 Tax=Leucobacter allii TaxID=2932247 RepID=A0ABY4FPL6_9MICO|nr:hypothetical protein [Leucobacter allii]UOQ58207.1 hypothetical protein MUN78_05005 [Leucobacter allii]UOR02789.1 hypothetical protein MUN77_05620 [Leucobacter allii]